MDTQFLEQCAKSKIFALENTRLRCLFEPALFRRRVDRRTAYHLHQFGALVGLTPSEVEATTRHHSSTVSRLCSRILLVLVVVFLIFVLAGLAGVNWASYLEEPISTYTPGTRYASIRPSDFGE